MFDYNYLFGSIMNDNEITIVTYLVCIGTAFICGIIAAIANACKSSSSKSFTISLILLPAIVTTVIIMVNGNVGTGIAVAGAFSLVRFRSVAGRARDIAGIFFAMTAGIVCASGYVAIALVFTVIISLAMILISLIPFSSDKMMDLNITIPESLQYANEFNDLFSEYVKKHRLVKVKTANMGSLYKLTYKVRMKDVSKTQEFIDKLRCRNGNLEISISEALDSGNEL